MKPLLLCLLFLLLVAPAAAEQPLPILDVHLHAVPEDHLGPPPLAVCTPMPSPAWDPSRPYPEQFSSLHEDPPCEDPVWSAETDEALMNQAIEEAPFLTAKQKRDIFYNNAARFLRLSDEEIARHHDE